MDQVLTLVGEAKSNGSSNDTMWDDSQSNKCVAERPSFADTASTSSNVNDHGHSLLHYIDDTASSDCSSGYDASSSEDTQANQTDIESVGSDLDIPNCNSESSPHQEPVNAEKASNVLRRDQPLQAAASIQEVQFHVSLMLRRIKQELIDPIRETIEADVKGLLYLYDSRVHKVAATQVSETLDLIPQIFSSAIEKSTEKNIQKVFNRQQQLRISASTTKHRIQEVSEMLANIVHDLLLSSCRTVQCQLAYMISEIPESEQPFSLMWRRIQMRLLEIISDECPRVEKKVRKTTKHQLQHAFMAISVTDDHAVGHSMAQHIQQANFEGRLSLQSLSLNRDAHTQ
eukprot:gnl/MRDRNA2_/MRDRNA2_135841_c0_seq1.p1 gnl/MRDRNA2_/MRDRNA2_135841_c0~~gnl/MRDRNA2_/MRDRNA2_135841_c0_seq1.p1  ORF type:complete len:343 (-),score=65.14 gnl/MRDRNA2_/MRDRNA2_135841_c0_seq1:87-1115(-)